MSIRYYYDTRDDFDVHFMRDSWGIILILFVVGLMTLSYVQGMSKFMILYGFILAGGFTIYFLYNRLTVQTEVLIYFGWIVWSLGGQMYAIDQELYFEQLKTIIEILVMIFVIAGVTAYKRQFPSVMIGLIVGGMASIVSSAVTGELGKSISSNSHVQSTGLAGNPNEYAYSILFILFAAFYFFRSVTSKKWRILLAVFAIIAIGAIVFSASRKTFLAVLVFVMFWWIFCSNKKLPKNAAKIYAIILILLSVIYVLFGYIAEDTYLGRRLENFQDTSYEIRVQMYKEGFEIVRKRPLWGVGLDNYRRLSSSGLYSHSDYIEVVANTGVVGFGLYFSIYLVLWNRLGRIKKITSNRRILYNIGLFKAAILTILFVGFGHPHISSKATWIFLAAAIGYSWQVEHKSRYIGKHYKSFGMAAPQCNNND